MKTRVTLFLGSSKIVSTVVQKKKRKKMQSKALGKMENNFCAFLFLPACFIVSIIIQKLPYYMKCSKIEEIRCCE